MINMYIYRLNVKVLKKQGEVAEIKMK